MNDAATRLFAPETFTVSRALDFLSERELTRQIGHASEHWPLVVVKELTDNALDAAEEAQLPPRIEVTVTPALIEVRDHGSGIPPETVEGALDLSSRTSSRAAYVGPTRGQQGHALKTILAMPFALDGEAGLVEIEARGILHRIAVGLDRVAQQPRIEHDRGASTVRNGTCVRVHWPVSACSIELDEIGRFLPLAAGFNPHLHLTVRIGDDDPRIFRPSDPAWSRWRPSEPLPVQWFTKERFAQLVGAAIHKDRTAGQPVRLVRDFAGGFRGLSSTTKRKAVLGSLGLLRAARLDALLTTDGEPDLGRIALLHMSMCDESRPPKPAALGIIGPDHWRAVLGPAIEPASFEYRRRIDDDLEAPRIAETCFAWMPDAKERRLLVGLNHSPAIAGADAFRGLPGAGTSRRGLAGLLSEQFAGGDQPVAIALHLVAARLDFTDTGKSAVAFPYYDEFGEKITADVCKVTGKWEAQRRAEIRSTQAMQRRGDALTPKKPKPVTIKDAAYRVLPAAYLKASTDLTLPANARQIYYAARGPILELTGKTSLDYGYFSQTLLIDFLRERPDQCRGWDVVFDERGTFVEPHTGRSIDLGTINVRNYVASLGEHIPKEHFANVLYVEKSGFEALFATTKLGERFDLGIIYAKGESVTAARELIDAFAAVGVRTFCIRDFDLYGFSIAKNLREDTDRYAWKGEGAIDLGLRLADVRHYDLESEPVTYKGKRDEILTDPAAVRAKIAPRLQKAGATADEIGFLLRRRIELNSMTSGQLVEWIERKLAEHGVAKVIPDAARIERDALWAIRNRIVKRETDKIMARLEARILPGIREKADEIARAKAGGKGAELRAAVVAKLEGEPELAWNNALLRVLPP